MLKESPDQIRFRKLFEMGKRLRSRYLLTVSARKLFDELNKLSSIKDVGKKKAEANVKILNLYKYFLLTSKEAIRYYLLIELAKFFDEDKRGQTLSVQNIIYFAGKRVESFSETEFKKFHKDRHILPELFKNFRSLSLKDLNKIKKRIARNKNLIKRLKDYRDKFLAHDDLNKKQISIHKREINTLLKIIRDTIGLIYSRLEFAVNSYRNYEEEPMREINRLFRALKEHEAQRLANIGKRYNI